MGMDRVQLEDLGKEEAQIRINPLEIPGCHYLCGPCEESDNHLLRLESLKEGWTLWIQTLTQISFFQKTQKGTDQSQETNDEFNPTASQTDSTE